MGNMKKICGNCRKFRAAEAGPMGYAPCENGGMRKSTFPACSCMEAIERPHNDDVNMFSKTDVKGGEND